MAILFLQQWALEEVGTLGNHLQVQMSHGDMEQSDFAFDMPALDAVAAAEPKNMQATNETATVKEAQPVPITGTPKF